MMRLRTPIGLTVALALGGCDAWPTVVKNRAPVPITLQYRAEGHTEWSGVFPIEPGKSERLAQSHWVQNILALRIEERGKSYDLTFKDLSPVRGACPSSWPARTWGFGPDCYVEYLGGGRLRSSFTEAKESTSAE